MQATCSRRHFIRHATLGAGAAALAAAPLRAAPTPAPDRGFRYALNTGTLRGYKLPLAAQIDLTADEIGSDVKLHPAELGQTRRVVIESGRIIGLS